MAEPAPTRQTARNQELWAATSFPFSDNDYGDTEEHSPHVPSRRRAERGKEIGQVAEEGQRCRDGRTPAAASVGIAIEPPFKCRGLARSHA